MLRWEKALCLWFKTWYCKPKGRNVGSTELNRKILIELGEAMASSQNTDHISLFPCWHFPALVSLFSSSCTWLSYILILPSLMMHFLMSFFKAPSCPSTSLSTSLSFFFSFCISFRVSKKNNLYCTVPSQPNKAKEIKTHHSFLIKGPFESFGPMRLNSQTWNLLKYIFPH